MLGGGEYSFAAVSSSRSPARHAGGTPVPLAPRARPRGGRDLRRVDISRPPEAIPVNVPTWLWWTTIGVTTALLLFDVVIVGRRPHEPSRKEVSWALTFYLGLAIAFGIGVWTLAGHQYGT